MRSLGIAYRARRAAAVAVLVAGSIVGVPSRASAGERPSVVLKPGQVVTFTMPSPSAQGKAAVRVATARPENCKRPMADRGAAEWCDSYPVRIDAPEALIRSGLLQLNATLEWKPGTTVMNCPQIGNCGTNEMGIQLWQVPAAQTAADPPADTTTAASGGATGRPDTPMSIAHVGAGTCPPRNDAATTWPKDGLCRLEYVTVGNYLGSNPYTLRLELADFSRSGPLDLSGDDLPPLDLSDVREGGTGDRTPVAPIAMPFASFADVPFSGAGAPMVDLPGLGGAGGFDGIGALGFGTSDLAERIVDRGPKALGAAGAPSALLLFLWLVLVPLAGLASFLAWIWRRRRDDGLDAATPA